MDKQIYFHLGLGKTGTTFLQYRAFPYFKGLKYIQRTQYKRAKRIIHNSDERSFFISFECDQQLGDVARDWAKDFPDTVPILVFRRQDSWIASQYRRFMKNCHVRSWTEFIDLKEDSGRFKIKDLEYYPMIEMLDGIFNTPTKVLLYDDMKQDVKGFIQGFAKMMNSTVDIDSLNLSSKHRSYTERQLKYLLDVSKHLPLEKKRIFKFAPLEFIRKWIIELTRYAILYTGSIMAERRPGESLILQEDLDDVKAHYNSDWEKVLERASQSKI